MDWRIGSRADATFIEVGRVKPTKCSLRRTKKPEGVGAPPGQTGQPSQDRPIVLVYQTKGQNPSPVKCYMTGNGGHADTDEFF